MLNNRENFVKKNKMSFFKNKIETDQKDNCFLKRITYVQKVAFSV